MKTKLTCLFSGICLFALASGPPAVAVVKKGWDLKPAQRYELIEPILRGEKTTAEVAAATGIDEDSIVRWHVMAVNRGRAALATPTQPMLDEFVKWLSGSWRLESRFIKGNATTTDSFFYVDLKMLANPATSAELAAFRKQHNKELGEFRKAHDIEHVDYAPIAPTAYGQVLIVESGILHSFASGLGDDGPFSMGSLADVAVTVENDLIRLDFLGSIVGSYGSFRGGEQMAASMFYENIGGEYVNVVACGSCPDGAGARSGGLDVVTVGPTTQTFQSVAFDAYDTYSKVSTSSRVLGSMTPQSYWQQLESSEFAMLRDGSCEATRLRECLPQPTPEPESSSTPAGGEAGSSALRSK